VRRWRGPANDHTDDFAKVMDLLKLRPMQFCTFLETLMGADQIELLVQAIKVAKEQGKQSGPTCFLARA
jgi:hypothetical protein